MAADSVDDVLLDAAERQTRDWRDQIAGLDRLRETLGYKATLQRGYAVVRGDGEIVTRKSRAVKATTLEIEFADGCLSLDRAAAPTAKKKPKSKQSPPDQGSLF